MVTREDVHLSMLPPESCSNCGFIAKSVSDADGSNGRNWEPILTSYERFSGLDEHNDAVWSGRKVATLRCWMRQDQEGPPATSRMRKQVDETTALMRKDRSEAAGGDYCPQFTPWVRHLDFKEHWEERKVYLLERDRRRLQKKMHSDAQATQRILASLTALTIGVTVLVGWCNADATRDAARIQSEQPITIVVSPQSTPDASQGQP